MRILVSFLFGFLFFSAASAAPLDTSKSSIHFVYTQLGVPIEGKFKKLRGDVQFDASKLSQAKAKIDIDLLSIDANNEDANEAMKMPEWLNSAQFPTATFVASQFKALEGGKYQVIGKFSLKGMSAGLTIPFTVRPEGKGLWLEGSFPLSRLAWKVGEGEWADVSTVADAVLVKFKLYVVKS